MKLRLRKLVTDHIRDDMKRGVIVHWWRDHDSDQVHYVRLAEAGVFVSNMDVERFEELDFVEVEIPDVAFEEEER